MTKFESVLSNKSLSVAGCAHSKDIGVVYKYGSCKKEPVPAASSKLKDI